MKNRKNPSPQQWIKCSERLPELSNDDRTVWVILGNPRGRSVIGVLEKHDGELVWVVDSRFIYYLECFPYWMPLPQPPEDQ